MYSDDAPGSSRKRAPLTTSAEREDARRFYESLGFSATHVGMKMNLRAR